MVDDRALRIKAGFELAKALGTTETRSMFATHGYVDDQQIVVVLDTDTVQYVFDRIKRHEPPVVIAIYWHATQKLGFTQIEPSQTISSYQPERDDVGGTTTIGMLYEHTHRQQNAQYRFKLGWGSSSTVTIASFDHISA